MGPVNKGVCFFSIPVKDWPAVYTPCDFTEKLLYVFNHLSSADNNDSNEARMLWGSQGLDRYFLVVLSPCFAASQVEEWKAKNQILRTQLRQHGIVAASVEPQWEESERERDTASCVPFSSFNPTQNLQPVFKFWWARTDIQPQPPTQKYHDTWTRIADWIVCTRECKSVDNRNMAICVKLCFLVLANFCWTVITKKSEHKFS